MNKIPNCQSIFIMMNKKEFLKKFYLNTVFKPRIIKIVKYVNKITFYRKNQIFIMIVYRHNNALYVFQKLKIVGNVFMEI